MCRTSTECNIAWWCICIYVSVHRGSIVGKSSRMLSGSGASYSQVNPVKTAILYSHLLANVTTDTTDKSFYPSGQKSDSDKAGGEALSTC